MLLHLFTHLPQIFVVMYHHLVPADLLLRTRGDDVKSQEMTGEVLGYTAAQLVWVQARLHATTRFFAVTSSL
jgi:hypothetical protein